MATTNSVSDLHTFASFPKMARLSREIIITEKIDGTNAQIAIEQIFEEEAFERAKKDPAVIYGDTGSAEAWVMRVGSRNRWIMPNDDKRDENGRKIDQDNYGFATWARDNAKELMKLGPGRHFGEWWGQGIARGYWLKERRFSLFNTSRWSDDAVRPECCHVVPVLYQGVFDTQQIEAELRWLAKHGSEAAPGFMNPEGIIVYHVAGNIAFKKTIHKDELPKALAA